uniref:Uncharacterized protein n=1 Tax=Arundo donax TaxID=35708 RepID=A0A0A8Z6I8_ARUDO
MHISLQVVGMRPKICMFKFSGSKTPTNSWIAMLLLLSHLTIMIKSNKPEFQDLMHSRFYILRMSLQKPVSTEQIASQLMNFHFLIVKT